MSKAQPREVRSPRGTTLSCRSWQTEAPNVSRFCGAARTDTSAQRFPTCSSASVAIPC